MCIISFTSDAQRVLAEAQKCPILGVIPSAIKCGFSVVQTTVAVAATVFSGIGALVTCGQFSGINESFLNSLSQIGCGLGGLSYGLFSGATLGLGGFVIESSFIGDILQGHNEDRGWLN